MPQQTATATQAGVTAFLPVVLSLPPPFRTSAVVEEQEQNQNPEITSDTVIYSSSQVPVAGEYLASGDGEGYLRKVVSATSVNGVVVAQTEAASLNEVLDTFEVSTTVKIARVPESNALMEMTMAADGSSVSARTHRWSKSGLTLSDSNQETQDQKLFSTGAGKLTLAEADTARTEQTISGHYINVTGPKYLAVSPGTTLKDSVQVKLKYDTASQKREICKIRLSEFTHDNSTLSKLSRPSARQSIAADKKSGSLDLSFSPTADYIDNKNRPYEAYITVYIDEKGDGCNGDAWNKTWDEIKVMKIPIYVQQGRFEVEDEEKTVTFTGDFTVTNKAELDFEPALNIDLQVSGMSLKTASLVAEANIRLANTLTIEASAEGNLSKTVTLLQKRSFVKVFPVGNVPVVVRGAFSMDARIDGHIGGAAKLTKFMELSFPDTSFGVKYSNGSWQEVKNFTPKYTFTIDGEADADASITLTLIPDLQIHFYDAASGRMILEPSLYAEAALHGQFKYHDINGDLLTDLDYWFPYLNAGVALDMRLYAGLHIMDYNIASWPSDVSYTEPEKFKVFHPITREEGKLYSLPVLEASADTGPADPPDSRAILVSGTATDYITPLFGWNLNPFQAWTEPKVVTDREYTMTPLDETREQHWFIPKQAGDFTVRLGGYSKLGWFVRQVADDVVLNLPDADSNGLPDYWESRFSLSGASGDDDNDGLNNLAEFNQGTDPTKLDSDGGGVSDGQEILDGTDPLDGSDDNVESVVTVAEDSIIEGNSGMKNLAFTLTLDEYYDAASVDYTTQDGTATAGSDYVSASGTVSFSGGSTSETVNVSILGDTDVEPNETFSLELSNPVNLGLGNTSTTGTIVDDDSSITTVVSATGRVWMDRNLGAARVATSVTDEEAYGDLYQWGRLADGHEKRNSSTTTTLSSTDVPGHDKFIITSYPYDWRSPKNDSLWQGVNGINNPCPDGFRLPTADEWQVEIDSWNSKDAAGAFASPLKLATTGFRLYDDGSFNWVDVYGYFWSSTVDGHYASYLNFGDALAEIYNYARSDAFAVRCIKDADLQDGLVAHYEFEDNADDSSGNENNGSEWGNVSYVSGVVGQAVRIGDVNDPGHIRVPNSDSLKFQDVFSVVYHVRLDSEYGMDGYGRISQFGYRTVFAKDHDRSGYFNSISLANGEDFLSTFVNNNYSSPKALAYNRKEGATPLHEWVHVAFVINKDQIIGYINGNETDRYDDLVIDLTIGNGKDLYIGKFRDSWFPLGGSLDDFRMYNRVLSASEVAELYGMGQ
ncbi:hypothetical protein GMJAKD_16145 [Candidatus Electrothrix aarhusensis]